MALVIKDGAKTSQEIKDALYDLEFDGESGKIKFDKKGNVSGGYDVYIVEEGSFVLEE